MRFVKWLPAAVWTVLILSAANDLFSSGNTASWLETLVGQTLPETLNRVVRKGGHIAGYSILALLAWYADRRPLRPLLLALAVALADESMQSLTLYREGSPFDVILDVSSAALMLLTLEKIRYTRGASLLGDRGARQGLTIK